MHLVATRAGIGRLDDGVVALLDAPFPHVGAALEQTGSLDCLAAARVLRRLPLEDVALVSPVGTPRALWGVGLNYRSKAARTGRSAPDQPILYLAAGSAVVGPDASIELPSTQTREMDYEGELAVVLGRRLFAAEPGDVWPAVAGITAANDVTARDVMRATGAPTLAKSFPGFQPLGASFRTVDEVAELDRIGVRTWLNGALVQDDDSSGMIFPILDLIALLSHFVALEPGDVVLTGTPAGTGQDRGCFLTAGDEIRVEVDGVLPLLTTVAPPAGHPADDAVLADRAG